MLRNKYTVITNLGHLGRIRTVEYSPINMVEIPPKWLNIAQNSKPSAFFLRNFGQFSKSKFYCADSFIFGQILAKMAETKLLCSCNDFETWQPDKKFLVGRSMIQIAYNHKPYSTLGWHNQSEFRFVSRPRYDSTL
jgi:hypothetical protein